MCEKVSKHKGYLCLTLPECISVYNLHNTKLRPVSDKTVEDEMMINFNGPLLGEADNTLKTALDKYFNNKPWHFTLWNNILRISGIITSNILSSKSKLPIYK